MLKILAILFAKFMFSNFETILLFESMSSHIKSLIPVTNSFFLEITISVFQFIPSGFP